MIEDDEMAKSEADLISDFKNALCSKGVDKQTIATASDNKSKIMDVNFIEPTTNTYISLEAKTFNDTRSNSNFFLSIFGKVIKGRHLNKNNKLCKGKNVEYGFLFDDSNKVIIRHYFSLIENNDWQNFCEQYDVKHIFILKSNNEYDVFTAKEIKQTYCKTNKGEEKNITLKTTEVEETEYSQSI